MGVEGHPGGGLTFLARKHLGDGRVRLVELRLLRVMPARASPRIRMDSTSFRSSSMDGAGPWAVSHAMLPTATVYGVAGMPNSESVCSRTAQRECHALVSPTYTGRPF